MREWEVSRERRTTRLEPIGSHLVKALASSGSRHSTSCLPRVTWDEARRLKHHQHGETKDERRRNAREELTEKNVKFAQIVNARGSFIASEEVDVADESFSVWRGTMAQGCRWAEESRKGKKKDQQRASSSTLSLSTPALLLQATVPSLPLQIIEARDRRTIQEGENGDSSEVGDVVWVYIWSEGRQMNRSKIVVVVVRVKGSIRQERVDGLLPLPSRYPRSQRIYRPRGTLRVRRVRPSTTSSKLSLLL